jgi:hypothetical protein
MRVTTVRLPDHVAQFVDQQSDATGLSFNAVVTAILDTARTRGWTVQPHNAWVVTDGSESPR